MHAQLFRGEGLTRGQDLPRVAMLASTLNLSSFWQTVIALVIVAVILGTGKLIVNAVKHRARRVKGTFASDHEILTHLAEFILGTPATAFQPSRPGLKERFSNLVDEVRRLGATVGEIHTEIKTTNGRSMGELAEEGEGRRIRADVPQADRTPGERHYVQHVDEVEAKAKEGT